MCFVLIALNEHADLPLVVLANRDEYYARPASAAHWWKGEPAILAGRDESAGGSWFGVRSDGRFATVTNIRAPHAQRRDRRSRGELVTGALRHIGPLKTFVEALSDRGGDYNPFNLLCGDSSGFWYLNNFVGQAPRFFAEGIVALANADLDTDWPKTIDGRSRLSDLLRAPRPRREALFDLLNDRAVYADERLPATGIPRQRERALSAIFIEDGDYGTRCSTLFAIDRTGDAHFEEHSHAGARSGPDFVKVRFDTGCAANR